MSFESGNDEEIDAAEIEEEDWIEYIKRSTNEAMKKIENEKVRCWNMTQRKIKWRLAMRIALSPSERWLIKGAEWNPELSSKHRNQQSKRKTKKKWEDDINEFLKQVEDVTENLTESSNQINKNWINTAKDRGRWTLLEEITQRIQKEDMKTIREREEILITYQRGTLMEWNWATKN